MRLARSAPIGLMLTVLASPSFAAPAPKDKGEGFATPQACFKAMQAALKQKDYKKFVAGMSTRWQETLARDMLLTAVSIGGKAGFKEEVQKILTRHKITRETQEKIQKLYSEFAPGGRNLEARDQMTRALPKYIKDRPGFVADMYAALMKVIPAAAKPAFDELKNVKITGVRAEATLTTGSGNLTTEQGVTFTKEKDGWRMNAPVPKDKPKK